MTDRNTYLLTWNPKVFSWDEMEEDMEAIVRGEEPEIVWSTGNTKRIKTGDRVFWVRLGMAPKGIVGWGTCTSDAYEDMHWDLGKAEAGLSAKYVRVRSEFLSREPVLSWEELQQEPFESYTWNPQASGRQIPYAIATNLIKTLMVGEDPGIKQLQAVRYLEGAKWETPVSRYERNKQASVMSHL